jgi:hypothetical protein
MNRYLSWLFVACVSWLLLLGVADPGTAQEPEVSDSATVRTVQTALLSLGLEVGPVDGQLGAQTRAALREFQRLAGLPVNGRLNVETIRRVVEVALLSSTIGGPAVRMEWEGNTFSLRDVERRCEVFRWSDNWGDVNCRSGHWERKVQRDCDVWFPTPDGAGWIDCRDRVLRPIERYCTVEMYTERYGTITCARRQ